MMPNTLCVNGGALLRTTCGLRFINPLLSGATYCNAQIDDYQGLPRGRFPNRPPLRLSLRARFSHPAGELTGTAGFGFWNDPFLMTELRMPTLPRALWFFYAAPPSDLRLAVDTPGYGWKAAALDALRLDSLAALPLAALAIPAMRNSQLYRRLWPYFERKFRIAEQLLDTDMLDGNMTTWHEYMLDWQSESATFLVDGRVILTAPAPRGPLGLVIWIDNQYMAVHPRGHLRYGLVAKPETQWMEIDALQLER
jgi:hypothetical protein